MSLTRSQAARQNGAKSRGPVTEAGRQRSSANSVKHGLTADKVVVLQNERPEVFDIIFNGLCDKFQPQDEIEKEFLLQAAAARWRLRRVWQVETTLWDLTMDEQREHMRKTFSKCDEGTRQAVAFAALADDSRALSLAHRYETRLSREYQRAISDLLTARALKLTGSDDGQPDDVMEVAGIDLPNEPKPVIAPVPSAEPPQTTNPTSNHELPNEPNTPQSKPATLPDKVVLQNEPDNGRAAVNSDKVQPVKLDVPLTAHEPPRDSEAAGSLSSGGTNETRSWQLPSAA